MAINNRKRTIPVIESLERRMLLTSIVDDTIGIGVEQTLIGGVVFADNGDGVFNRNPDNLFRDIDIPLSGVRVYEDRNNNAQWDQPEPGTVTNENGQYELLVSIVSRISVIRPAGWVRFAQLSVGFGTVDIPMQGSSQITGTVSEALNPNNANSGRLSGMTVFADRNLDGVLDPGEETSITDDTGHFELLDLDNGTLRVTMNAPGWTSTWTPPIINLVPLGRQGYNLTLYRSMAVHVVIYDDLNRDGKQDAREGGVGGALVDAAFNIEVLNLHPTLTTHTAADGSFVINDVPAHNTSLDIDVKITGTFIKTKIVSLHVEPLAATRLDVPMRVFGGVTGSAVQLTRSGRQVLRGVRVYVDMNNNRKRDKNEPSAISDAYGIYRLTPVTGKFTLRLIKKYRDLSLLSKPRPRTAVRGDWVTNDPLVFLGPA